MIKKLCGICLKFLKIVGICALVLALVASLLAIFYYTMDFIFKGILPHLSRSVLSNFIIFVAIIVVVSKIYIRPNEILEQAQNEIKDKIEKSEKEKQKSSEDLISAQERIKNIDTEIQAIVENIKNSTQQVGKKIIQEANKTITGIESNTDKVIKNNQVLLKKDVIKRTSNALLEIAKMNILKELDNNPDLHHKLIDESINAMVISKEQV